MNFVQLCDDLNGLLAKQRKNYEGGVSKGAFNGQVNYFFIKKKKWSGDHASSSEEEDSALVFREWLSFYLRLLRAFRENGLLFKLSLGPSISKKREWTPFISFFVYYFFILLVLDFRYFGLRMLVC
jgi:hypothetical protein